MSFITTSQLLDRIAAGLKQASAAALPAYWTTIATGSVAWSYAEILNRLMRRGLTKSQVDGWDLGSAFQMDLAIYHAMNEGGAYDAYDQKFIKDKDRREELDKSILVVSGITITPDGTAGQCSTGEYVASGSFNWPDTNGENGIRW